MITTEQVYQETLHFVSGNDDYVVTRNWTSDILKIKKLEEHLEMQQAAWRELNRELSWVIDERDELERVLRKVDNDLDNRNFLESSSVRDTIRSALDKLEDYQ